MVQDQPRYLSSGALQQQIGARKRVFLKNLGGNGEQEGTKLSFTCSLFSWRYAGKLPITIDLQQFNLLVQQVQVPTAAVQQLQRTTKQQQEATPQVVQSHHSQQPTPQDPCHDHALDLTDQS